MKNIRKISTKELHRLANLYGKNTLIWRRKFIGLLPEINRRRSYEKHGHSSIFVFAKKVAGLSEEQVRRALNLEKRFEHTPVLQKMLVTGEVSMNKLARVASIAEPENENALAEAVRQLPNRALETLVHDEKEIQNGFCKPKIEAKSVHVHRLELSNEVADKLLELQEKGIDVNAFLTETLVKREQEIQQEKEQIARELEEKSKKSNRKRKDCSRYRPAKVQKILHKEHGTKCSIPGCNKHAVHVHHTRPFALHASHDPRYLAPLCKEHHAIAHLINLRVHENRRL
jgi:hypothetical protein